LLVNATPRNGLDFMAEGIFADTRKMRWAGKKRIRAWNGCNEKEMRPWKSAQRCSKAVWLLYAARHALGKESRDWALACSWVIVMKHGGVWRCT